MQSLPCFYSVYWHLFGATPLNRSFLKIRIELESELTENIRISIGKSKTGLWPQIRNVKHYVDIILNTYIDYNDRLRFK